MENTTGHKTNEIEIPVLRAKRIIKLLEWGVAKFKIKKVTFFTFGNFKNFIEFQLQTKVRYFFFLA